MKHEDLIKKIDELKLTIAQKIEAKAPINPADLSELGVKLACLNDMLGGELAGLKRQQIEAETEVFKMYSKDKSATFAKEQVRQQTIYEREAFEKAEIKHADVWKLISMIQTHINSEREERRNESNQ